MKKILYIIIATLCLFPFFVLATIQLVWGKQTTIPDGISEKWPVGMVLGTGVYAGKPRPLLEERLKTAAELYRKGKVVKLVLSGDSRSADYDEPLAMKKYLIAAGVPEKALEVDGAGLRTYESCVGLKERLGYTKTLVITQDFHIPRALFTCQMLGIEARGVSAALPDEAGEDEQDLRFREYFATLQAFYEVFTRDHSVE